MCFTLFSSNQAFSKPLLLPGECTELVLKFVNYIYEFHGLMVLAPLFCFFLLFTFINRHVRYNTREDIAIAFLASRAWYNLNDK